jgi:hypothetical protein
VSHAQSDRKDRCCHQSRAGGQRRAIRAEGFREYEKGTDFTQFRSYAWITGTPVLNPNLDLYILTVSDGILQSKGFHKVQSKDADVLITYHAAGDSNLNVSGFTDRLTQGLAVQVSRARPSGRAPARLERARA